MTYTPTYQAAGPCDWCDAPAAHVILDPFALASHSSACTVHAAEHYGIPAGAAAGDLATFTRDAAAMVRANDAARNAHLAALMFPYLTRNAAALVGGVR